MKFFGICLSLITIALMYIQLIDQKSEIFVRLMLYQSNIPIPIWLLSGVILVISFLFYRNSNEKIKPKPSKNQDTKKIESDSDISEPLENFEKTNFSVDEVQFIQMIEDKINDLHFPSSAKVVIDAKKNIPFTVYGERSTIQQAKRIIEEFAIFLNQIPLPQRIFFRFDDVMKSGVPLQNIVRGGLQKHLNISDVKITSQQDGVDVQFVMAQEPWISKPNLKRRF